MLSAYSRWLGRAQGRPSLPLPTAAAPPAVRGVATSWRRQHRSPRPDRGTIGHAGPDHIIASGDNSKDRKDWGPALQSLTDMNEDDPEHFVTPQGVVEEVQEEDATIDEFGESTEGDLHLVSRMRDKGAVHVLGLNSADDIVDVDIAKLQASTRSMLSEIEGADEDTSYHLPHNRIYCNRTLNLRSIKVNKKRKRKRRVGRGAWRRRGFAQLRAADGTTACFLSFPQAIGYDMDYTLVFYGKDRPGGQTTGWNLRRLLCLRCAPATTSKRR